MTFLELHLFRSVRTELENLRSRLVEAEAGASTALGAFDPAYRASAVNLLHYLVARQTDLRPLQLQLWRHGLSSLGRLEGHVRDSLDQVLDRLDDALARPGEPAPGETPEPHHATTWDDAERLLHLHTRELFGPKPSDRHVYVMVTAPDASEVNETWVSRLLDAGMNVLRINGAHEGPQEWDHIVKTARRVAKERGASLRVLVDLPGPKLRTVAPGPGPSVDRWKPIRDAFGLVTEPARIRLLPRGAEPSQLAEGSVGVPAALWSELQAGDELTFRDARAKKRRMIVSERTDDAVLAELRETAYVVPETIVKASRRGSSFGKFRVGAVVGRPFQLTLAAGDRFILRSPPIGPEELGGSSRIMGCSSPEALLAPCVGARVLFDDGKLECVVESSDARGLVLRVVHASSESFRLRGEKGINFPDTALGGPALGPDDERALAFAVASADVVGASFIRGPDDVRAIHRRLDELGAEKLGLILKIETTGAFAVLPAILLAAMMRHPVGVMIARGDLAVEAGFVRLAELQEEILWLCEAAHLPVVWATQVLDQLAHCGTATRAEVTDAAMAVRAECVMLNKGPHIAEAVTTLVEILRRMEDHQYKKRSLYRKLHLELPRLGSPSVAPLGTSSGPASAKSNGTSHAEQTVAFPGSR